MNGISERLADSLANGIKKYDPSAPLNVMRYALINLFDLLICMAIVLIIGLVTGHFWDGLIAILSFSALRYFSGGLHFKSANTCNVISSVLVIVCIFTPIDYWYNGLVINAIAVLMIAINAPANMARNTLKKKDIPLIKAIAVCIVCTNFIFQSGMLSLVFFTQALTTLGFFQKVLDKYKL